MNSKNVEEKPTGRPKVYKEEFAQQLEDFYDVEPYEEREIDHFDKDGNVKWTDIKRMANKLPTIGRFAKKIGVSRATVYNWLDLGHESHEPTFLDAYTRAQHSLKEFLIVNGLENLYNPIAFKFVAVNMTDMRDKVEHEISKKPSLIMDGEGFEEAEIIAGETKKGTNQLPE